MKLFLYKYGLLIQLLFQQNLLKNLGLPKKELNKIRIIHDDDITNIFEK